ncbi:hypothetical protein KGF57_000510 [Candida theae]|uniref:ADP-ribosylation factor-like protein 2 n=1 Tax=Candida theae TaxID=1198502 RepID=A0AAD5BIU3_9ASCO|nr:uncharacterized protein KGF57_000510 [Candida theae]KAI5967081.1 hypothetical protein KGF57_000510 [Candida theae]
MGLLTIIRNQKRKDKEIRMLVLGLDNSGKTTIVKNMFQEDVDGISPTMGFQIQSLSYRDYTINMWDIGGQTSLRAFWSNYFDKTDVVLWVIDGVSVERVQESYQELHDKIIEQDRLVGVYLVIAINKIDLVAKSELKQLKDKVSKLLSLEEVIPERDHWNIELVSGKTGDGIEQVLQWVITREY